MDDLQSIGEKARDIWDKNSDCWDTYVGEGTGWHKLLVEPSTLRLLDVKKGESILDIACGNGNFSRELASLGANVHASDFSPGLIEKAKARTKDNTDLIEYQVLDATDAQALQNLGEQSFDGAVCCMALFDMVEIAPLANALSKLLKPKGRFVFSVIHPCFNSGEFKKVTEREETDGTIKTEYAIKRSTYIKSMTYKGLALAKQPEPQFYFHRSLSEILNTFFQAGFTVDGFEEPVFDSDDDTNSLSRQLYKEIPPIMVVRVRL